MNPSQGAISSRIDQNHNLYKSKFESLEHTLAQVLEFMQSFKTRARNSEEDPTTKGEKDKEEGGDNKGNISKDGSNKDTSEASQDKSKGK